MSILDKITCVLGFALLIYFLLIKPSLNNKTKEVVSKNISSKIIKDDKLIDFKKNKLEKDNNKLSEHLNKISK